jgi:hypothetical protein
MESPTKQQTKQLDTNCNLQNQEDASPVRPFDCSSPSCVRSDSKLSPHIQGILDRGLAEDLSRIFSKANDSVQDLESVHVETLEGPQPSHQTHQSAFLPASIKDVVAIRDDNGANANTEPSVAETIAELQELVFEWEDLYFQENDVVPDCANCNLYVWALCGRRPVPISVESLTFGFGRVYIILHVKSFEPSPIMTCFYWTGHKAHFSSVACAAVHVIQLSRRIGCLKTSRQMEGIETVEFFDAIGKFFVVPSSVEPSLQVPLPSPSFVPSAVLLKHFLQKHIPPLHTSFAVLCDCSGYARVEHRLSHAKAMIAQKHMSHCVVVDCGTVQPALHPAPLFCFFILF